MTEQFFRKIGFQKWKKMETDFTPRGFNNKKNIKPKNVVIDSVTKNRKSWKPILHQMILDNKY
jgi:hypothetical protein